MATQRTVPIYIANLWTTEKYFDHWEVECWSDVAGSPGALLFSSDGIKGQYNSSNSRFEQNDIYVFEGTEIGLFYQFRSRVWPKGGGPPSAWSAWAREQSGDTTAPTQTYGSAYAVAVNSGICVFPNPTSPSSDTDHYEFYFGLNAVPTVNALTIPNLPDSRDKTFPSVSLVMNAVDTAYVYVRAVDTSGNKQSWVALGAFNSIGQQLIDLQAAAGGDPSHGQNVLFNGGAELGVSFWEPLRLWPDNSTLFALVDSFPGGAHSGNSYFRLQVVDTYPTSTSGGQTDATGQARHIEVNPGDVLYFGGWMLREGNLGTSSPNGIVKMILEVTDKDHINPVYGTAELAIGVIDTWVFCTSTYTVPAGKKYIRVYQQVVGSSLGYNNVTARFDDMFLCFVRRLSDSTIGKTGSTPPAMFNAFTYTSTTSSITWSWNLTGYRADDVNTTFGENSSQATGSLSISTTYSFYPFWDEDTQHVKMVETGGSGTPLTWAHPQTPTDLQKRTWAAEQARQNHIPLSLNGPMFGATTSGGSGGGGGGGDGGCLYYKMFVKERTKGVIRATEVCVGDYLWSKNDTWLCVVQVGRRLHDLWIVVSFNNGAEVQVTTGHPFTTSDGGVLRACQMTLETACTCPTGEAYVTSLLTKKESADKVIIELEEPHVFYASSDGVNWILVHNQPLQTY